MLARQGYIACEGGLEVITTAQRELALQIQKDISVLKANPHIRR